MTYTIRKWIYDTDNRCKPTTIATEIDRETAKRILKGIGKDLRNIKLNGLEVYKGIENGNRVSCIIFAN